MPVLYVAVYGGYALDQTRTAVIGQLPSELQPAYEATVAIQNAVIAAVKPGTLGSDLYAIAVDVAEGEGISEGFGRRGDNQARFVGHGFGIEIDELPLLAPCWKKALQPNIIFALEPKYLHPTLGIVGVENAWLGTNDGVERLTELKAWLWQTKTGKSEVHEDLPTASDLRRCVVLRGQKVELTRDEALVLLQQEISQNPAKVLKIRRWYVDVAGQKVSPKWAAKHLFA
jgi:hypothetical protein